MKNKQTILIVDDDSVTLGILETLLNDIYHVLSAGSGQEARTLLSTSVNQEIDLILTDYQCSIVSDDPFDGVDVIHLNKGKIPLILMSAALDKAFHRLERHDWVSASFQKGSSDIFDILNVVDGLLTP